MLSKLSRTDLGIQRNDFENEPNVQKFNFKYIQKRIFIIDNYI